MKIFNFFYKFILFIISSFILFNLIFYFYCLMTPKMSINKAQSFYIYDNKDMLAINSNMNEWVSLDEISNHLINATISTEDKHFYEHTGFDYPRILKAMYVNLLSSSKKEGASTITQQYARNLFLNFDKTWQRKFDEAILAFELETHYTKDEILEGYLNTINYGGVFGIENASKYYFDKSAKDLTLAEATILAGIPKSPSNYSPLVNENLAKNRQNTILNLMVKNNYITENERLEAINVSLTYVGKKENEDSINARYYQDAVTEELKSIGTIPSSLITTGGLKIYTTLDTNAQKLLEDNIDNLIPPTSEIEASAVMMDPNDGGIIALIGGRDYSKSEFNRATSSKRQVGSTMKPFLYYAALENGFTASSSFTSEQTIFTFSGNQTYAPKNYNDKYPNSPISMAAAISYSDNIYAVKTHLFLGEDVLVDMAKRVGISENLQEIPSLALGSEEIGIIEMVRGYAAFANEGYKVKPHLIEKVEDSKGNILYEFKPIKENILNKSITFILNDLLTTTYDSNFIDYNYPTVISLLPEITNKYAIKSGTTDSDVWVIGYNKNVVLGIWNGYDDNRFITSEDYGYSKNIWIKTMESYLKDKDNKWYDIPNNVVGVLANPITGNLATDEDKNKRVFYYIKGTEPYYDSADLDAVFKNEETVETEKTE